MSRKKYEAGQSYSRWLVQSLGPKPGWALCKCDCGTEKDVWLGHLATGKSLGCSACKELGNNRKHGLRKTPTYYTWQNMKTRCSNPNFKEWHLYGGKGIRVCDKWQNFEGFLDDMGEKPEGMTLDRIDSSGNYCKANCRWSTAKQQANNISTNRVVIFDGRRFTISELADHLKVPYPRIYARFSRGQKLDGPKRYSKEWHDENAKAT